MKLRKRDESKGKPAVTRRPTTAKARGAHAGSRPVRPARVTLEAAQISEDEADLIIALRRESEPGIPLKDVLAEHGYERVERRSNAVGKHRD